MDDVKLLRAAKLFDEIKDLFPEGSVSLNIHHINIDQLDDNWIIINIENENGYRFKTAKRKNSKEDCFDITLFD